MANHRDGSVLQVGSKTPGRELVVAGAWSWPEPPDLSQGL